MRLDEVVAEGHDIVDGQLGGGVRIHHSRVVDVLLLLGHSGLDGEELNIDVGDVHGCNGSYAGRYRY